MEPVLSTSPDDDHSFVCIPTCWSGFRRITFPQASAGRYPANTDKFQGYQLVQKLSREDNAEKIIWRGKGPGNINCVLCFPKNKLAEAALQRERKILEHLGPHDNIIGLLDLIEKWGGQANLWCLVIELVEPLGYDMCEVYNQQAKASQQTVPIHQVKHYVIQIASALERLRSKGIVHRDMKADNVLITGAHQVKLIDFGMAIGLEGMVAWRIGHQAGYSAPELTTDLGDYPADLFGIGIIIYSLCTGYRCVPGEFAQCSRRGQLESFLKKRNVTGEALEAAQNLLHHDPKKRWTIDQVKEWAGRVSLSRTRSGTASPFQHWSSHFGEIPQVFGLNLANEQDGKSIGELNLSRRSSMHILLIIRNGLRAPGDIISVPKMETVLEKNDWLCFGVGKDENIDLNEQKKIIEDILKIPHDETPVDNVVARCAKDAKCKGLYPSLAEFDELPLPPHCANAILGPVEFAEDGQNALNLRKIFGINLAGLVQPGNMEPGNNLASTWQHGKPRWFPGAGAKQGGLIRQGDCGLIIRVPPPGSGAVYDQTLPDTFMPSITRDQWETLLDEDSFRHSLGLADDAAAWATWMKNSSRAS